MIGKDTVDGFARGMVDHWHRKGVGRQWADRDEANRDQLREAVTEGFRAIGVKVEGDGEPKPLSKS